MTHHRALVLGVVTFAACQSSSPDARDITPTIPVSDAGAMARDGRGEDPHAASEAGPADVMSAADVAFACADPLLCPAFLVASSYDGTLTPHVDLDSARCVLRALRDRTVGRLDYTIDRIPYESLRRVLHILGDGTVYEQQDQETEGPTYHDHSHYLPLPPESFAACLTATDPFAVTNCLRATFKQADVTTPLVCAALAGDGGASGP
jgi:hypothetical protein